MAANLNLTPLATEIVSNMVEGRGFPVWWDYSGTQMTPDQLRDVVTNAGGDPSRVSDIDPVKALRQAVKDWNKQETRTDLSLGLGYTTRTKVNSRIASEEGTDIYIGILHAARRGKRETGDDQRETLHYCTSTHTWVEPGTSKFSASLRALIQKRQTYYDGSALVNNVIMPAINSCNSAFYVKKGWWFLPSEHAEEVARVQGAISSLESFQLHVGGIPSNMGYERALHNGARDNLATEIENIEKLVDGWVDMSRVVRSDTRDTVMERFDSINQRITLFSASLEVSLSDMQTKAQELRQRATELIDLKDDEFGRKAGGSTARSANRRATVVGMSKDVFEQAWLGFCVDAEGNPLPMPADKDEAIDTLCEALAAMEAA